METQFPETLGYHNPSSDSLIYEQFPYGSPILPTMPSPAQTLDGSSFSHAKTLCDQSMAPPPSDPNGSSPSPKAEALDDHSGVPSPPSPATMASAVETLDGSSPSMQDQALDDHYLIHSPSNPNGSFPISATIPLIQNRDGSSPSSHVEAQDDHSNPNGSSPFPPILDDQPHLSNSEGSASPMHKESVDGTTHPDFFAHQNDDPLEEYSLPLSPKAVFSHNLSNYYSSSQWSSPWPNRWCYPNETEPSPWRSWHSFREARRSRWFSQCHSSGETEPSVYSFSVGEIKPSGVGAGLANLGNTCFVNAVLQCFTHTVPLVQGLRSFDHAKLCDRGIEGFCVLCALLEHFESSLALSGGIISPLKLVDNLDHFSTCFRRYQQEDAHEFLQCLLDKLERCCLDSKTEDTSSSTQDHNIVDQVFGGRLISKLRCCNCGHCSDTYEPLIDLSLEIEDVITLLSALESFTKVENIEDPEAKFTCENCKEEVSMEKQLLLEQAPSVAAFHLKRFKTDGSSVEKIDKHVEYPLELDLQPFTSGSHNNDVELKYELYAVVVHVGLSSSSGHYFCFVRSSPNTWHKLDDSKVASIQEDFVLSQEAYILFYARQGTPWFLSLMEAQKSCLDPNISNTSPKSVLDNVDTNCISNPSEANIDGCRANESKDATEETLIHYSCRTRCKEPKTRDAVEGISATLHDGVDVNESRDDTPMIDTSMPLGASNDSDRVSYKENIYTTSSLGANNCNEGTNKFISNDGFHPLTPPRPPSPDMFSEKITGTSCDNPRDHLRSKNRVSCKRSLNRVPKDSPRKEAVRFAKTRMSTSRGMTLIAAMQGSVHQGSVNKSKKRGMGSSPYKKASPSSARRKASLSSVIHPVAAAVLR